MDFPTACELQSKMVNAEESLESLESIKEQLLAQAEAGNDELWLPYIISDCLSKFLKSKGYHVYVKEFRGEYDTCISW